MAKWLEDPPFEPASEDEILKAKLKEIVLVGHSALGDGALFVNADRQQTSTKLGYRNPSDIRCNVLCLVGNRKPIYDLLFASAWSPLKERIAIGSSYEFDSF